MNVIPIDTSACKLPFLPEKGIVAAEVQVVWNQGMAGHHFTSLTEPLSSQGLNYVFSFKMAEVHDLKLSFLDESFCVCCSLQRKSMAYNPDLISQRNSSPTHNPWGKSKFPPW